MGRGHQIDIFCPLGDEAFHSRPKSGAVHGRSHRLAADGGVLAVFAAQGAAAKENGAAAAAACQGRLFPSVDHGLGHQGRIRAAAEAHLPGSSVHPTLPGTQLAVYITHKIKSFYFHKYSFWAWPAANAKPRLLGFASALHYPVRYCASN